MIPRCISLCTHCHCVRPAAVDSTTFQPDLSRRQPGGRVTVVALSRLVYRKGIDLLNVVIPAVCRRQPHVDFIIGADIWAYDVLCLPGRRDRIPLLGHTACPLSSAWRLHSTLHCSSLRLMMCVSAQQTLYGAWPDVWGSVTSPHRTSTSEICAPQIRHL